MRSKTLCAANILATLYSLFLLWVYGGAVIQAGGLDFIEYVQQSFELIFNLIGFDSVAVNIIYTVAILLCVHIVAFVLGAVFGWLGFVFKKSGFATFAAVLYLVGTVCFPVYLFFGLPVTIVGFIGKKKQKQCNQIDS